MILEFRRPSQHPAADHGDMLAHAKDDPNVTTIEAEIWGIEDGIIVVPSGDRAAALQDARQRLKAAVAACGGQNGPTIAR